MDTLWSELTIDGIDVEECEISREDFERLFNGEKKPSGLQERTISPPT